MSLSMWGAEAVGYCSQDSATNLTNENELETLRYKLVALPYLPWLCNVWG